MAAGRAKNVVLISLDTLRYDCVGACPEKTHLRAWGAERSLHTPNLDAFFQKSIYFTNAVTTAPYTTSAHASVMTGLYPNHHGVRPFYKWGLADGVGTLAEELKRRGYNTVAVQGGGDVTLLRTGVGVLRGFDAFFREERAACAHCASRSGPSLLFIHVMDFHAPYCWSGVEDVRAESWAWEAAEKEVYRRLRLPRPPGGDKRGKMEFHFWAVEQAHRRLGDEAAVRLFLDWYVRGVNWFDRVRWPRIVGALDDAGLYDDALIVVFADHGEAALPDVLGPPLDHGPSLLEDVLRVPLLLRGPGLKPGMVSRQCSLVDVAPVVLDYLGFGPLAIGNGGQMDGESLLRVAGDMESKKSCHFAEAWRTFRSQSQWSPQAWRGEADDPCKPDQVCVRCGKWKLLWHVGALRLRRYMRSSQQLPHRLRRLYNRTAALRAAYRSVLPLRARLWLRGLPAKLAGRPRKPVKASASAARPVGRRRFRWREAPVFVVDLSEDPLERRPRRVNPAALVGVQKDLLDRLKEYWEDGVQGPQIRLGDAEADKVMQNLRDLGYVD